MDLIITVKTLNKTHIQSIKNVFTITGCNDLLICLKKPKMIIDYIEGSSKKATIDKYSINSKKAIIESILFVITNFNINLTDNVKEKYKDYFNILKIKSSEKTERKKIILILMY